jgi:DNA repair protein RadD
MSTLFEVSGKEIVLHDWQEEAVQALRDNIYARVKNQILAAPTGSGKTVCATHLVKRCEERGQRAIFICDKRVLVEQTSDTFDMYGIPHGVYMPDHWRDDPDGTSPILVATAQTLESRKWPQIKPNLVIVDEAHGQRGFIVDYLKKREAVTIGLTATPFSKGLGQIYDTVVNVRTLNQLTKDGYLAPFDTYAPAEPDMSDVKSVAGEWSDRDAERKALPIIGDAVAEYIEKAMGKKFIAFGVTIKHCEELKNRFIEAGINCELYTSDTPEEIRKATVGELKDRNSNLMGLISVAALSKGFDAPIVECVIMCRPLRSSFAEHIQILGRGLRKDPDNPGKRCTILDLSGNMIRFWRQMQDFFEHGVHELDDGKKKERKPMEAKEPEPVKCPACAAVHRPLPTCPRCGHAYTPRSRIHHLPGKLVALGTITPASETDLRQDVYSQLLHIAESRPGWNHKVVAVKFKQLFGEYPSPHLHLISKPPTDKLSDWVVADDIRWNKSKRRRR